MAEASHPSASFPRILRGLRATASSPAFWGWAAVVMGVVFRLAEYANNRGLWMDEDYLRANVVGRPIFDFVTPMVHDQLAPPGFLALARAWVRVAGGSVWAIRILPLMFGIASLFALRAAAIRYVDRAAVAVALWVCASSWELVYFGTEFKQYSSDLLVTLMLLMLADDLARHDLTPRRFALASLVGMMAAWCSIPSIFVLGGIGLSLAIDAAIARRWRRLAGLALLGLLWVGNFAACFAVCRGLLGPSDFMWTWWDFAFLRLPPRSASDLSGVFWTFANVFIAPCGLDASIFPVATALLAVWLFAFGVADLGFGWASRPIKPASQPKRGGVALSMLLLPIVLAMIASALRRYPFHGRLLVYLVPSFVLPMAQGVAMLGRRLGLIAVFLLSLCLIAIPTVEALSMLDRSRPRGFDSHGDPRNDLLDHFEKKATTRALIERIKGEKALKPPSKPSSP